MKTNKTILNIQSKIEDIKKEIPKKLSSEETLYLSKSEVRNYRKKLSLLHRLEYKLYEAEQKLNDQEELFEQVLEKIKFLNIRVNKTNMQKLCTFLMKNIE